MIFFFLEISRPPRPTLFPYTTSSDLGGRVGDHGGLALDDEVELPGGDAQRAARVAGQVLALAGALDRKSTRLNSSHVKISYAVFCLKKTIWSSTRLVAGS